jgi:signal transduction histidine kinase
MSARRLARAVPRETLAVGVLCLAYAVTLWFTVSLQPTAHVPPLWPANGFVAAMVLLLNRRALLACLIFAVLFSALTLLPQSPDLATGLIRLTFNLGEGVAAGLASRRVLGPRPLLRTTAGFLRLELLAILPTVLATVFLREVFRAMIDPTAAVIWKEAFLPHLMGMAIVLPAAMLVFQPSQPELKRSPIETVTILGGLAVTAFFIIRQTGLPVGFMITPMLLLAALRLGPRGSVFGILIVGLICLPAAIEGSGAFAIYPGWSLARRALIYQGVCLSSLIGMTVAAFMVAEQARLKRLLVRLAASARESRRRALIASRAKSDFLATMSHEIRTPMNSILGFTQVLLADPETPRSARDKIEVIAQAGDSLLTVLNDILDFSKVEAGQVELHTEPLDIAACAAHAIEIVQGPARAKGLTIRLQAEGLEGRYEADGQRLRQILLNLLNNAVKFTEEGHVLLSVTLSPDKRALRFEVRDTGIGVDPGVAPRLFMRFSQADSSTTRDYGGTGLGLAICKGLVERMGGRIGVESRKGMGSTFWFELPAPLHQERQGAPQPAAAPAAGLQGRVLLVDDHEMNRRLGETLLTLLGFQVQLAASGEEAVEAATLVVFRRDPDGRAHAAHGRPGRRPGDPGRRRQCPDAHHRHERRRDGPQPG